MKDLLELKENQDLELGMAYTLNLMENHSQTINNIMATFLTIVDSEDEKYDDLKELVSVFMHQISAPLTKPNTHIISEKFVVEMYVDYLKGGGDPFIVNEEGEFHTIEELTTHLEDEEAYIIDYAPGLFTGGYLEHIEDRITIIPQLIQYQIEKLDIPHSELSDHTHEQLLTIFFIIFSDITDIDLIGTFNKGKLEHELNAN